MSEHIAFIRNITSKQVVTLKNEIKHKRRKTISPRSSSPAITSSKTSPYLKELREDSLLLNGKVVKIRRCYVEAIDTGSYFKVGWVVTCDVDSCMVCCARLGNFVLKHHCRACGNVVCQNCSSAEAIVSEVSTAGPVRVCMQCFWGQSQVSAFFNHSLGVLVASDEQHTPISSSSHVDEHAPAVINLRLYGQLTMCNVTPVFAIKTRRHDRSVVYVNICSCSEVPFHDHEHNVDVDSQSQPPHVLYMVSGPPVNLHSVHENDGETHTTRLSESRGTSIYDVAVNPRVIHEAIQDHTYSQFSMISEQALTLLTNCCGEKNFSRYQFTSEDAEGHYVTEATVRHSFCGGSRPETTEPLDGSRLSEGDDNQSSHNLSLMKPSSTKTDHPEYQSPRTPSQHSPQLAIPSPLAFRKLQHIAASPSDLSERPVNAESEVEFDSYDTSPCSTTGKHMSMVHQLMKQKQMLDRVDANNVEPSSARSRNHSEEKVANSVDIHSTDAPHHTLFATTKSLTIIANPGFVVKTKRLDAHPKTDNHIDERVHEGDETSSVKVFINVLHHESVDDLLANQTVVLKQSEKPLVIFGSSASQVSDKEGESCVLYTVAVGSEYFTPEAVSGEKGQTRITDPIYVKKIIAAVNHHFGDTLCEDSYSLPRLKHGFKGDAITLTTFTFSTSASDPLVALVHDLEAQRALEQQTALEREAHRQQDDCTDRDSLCSREGRSHSREKHLPRRSLGSQEEHTSALSKHLRGIAFEELTAEGDDVSVLTENTDWHDDHQTSLRSVSGGHSRRSTLRLSIFGSSSGSSPPPIHNEGRALLTSDDMLTYIKALSVGEADARRLKMESVADPGILLGWQVVFPKRNQDHLNLPVHVVTGIRKSGLTRKTEYRVSSRDEDDYWTQLKRSDAKSGAVFWPLRKALFLDQPTTKKD